MKILLVQPPIRDQVWAGVPDVVNDRFAHLFPPLSVMYLSSYLKNHTKHTCEVVDFRLDDPPLDQIGERIAAARPDVLGITANSHNLVNVATVIEAAKRRLPDLPIILGGSHVNTFPELAAKLSGVDLAISGDGEEALAAVLDRLERGADPLDVPGVWRYAGDAVQRGPATEPLEDLDALPFPDRSWMPSSVYFTPGMREKNTSTVISSRGCPYRCIYCSVPKKYRSRSAANIVEELDECEKKYGIREIHFVDDLFNITEQRVMDISEEILQRNVKMLWGFKGGCRNVSTEMLQLAKRAGCVRAHYGVETYTDDGLRALGKNLTISEIKRAFALTNTTGIRSIAYIIIGSPHERTLAQVEGVSPFVCSLHPDYVVYSLFSPYPESESFRIGVERRLWSADVWQKFMLAPTANHNLPTCWTEHLSKDQLVKTFRRINFAFYAHPRTLWRTFRKIGTLSEFKRIIMGGISLLRLWLVHTGNRRI